MKTYPKHEERENEKGFTADEIRRGIHWVDSDVFKVMTGPDWEQPKN